jgi:hypothetical protein
MKSVLTLVALFVTGLSHAQDYEKRPWMPLENRIGLALVLARSLTWTKTLLLWYTKASPKTCACSIIGKQHILILSRSGCKTG